MFDSNAAVARCARMWRRLGGLFEKAALEQIEAESYALALNCARMADVCFWQATGEIDSVSWKDVLPPPSEGGAS